MHDDEEYKQLIRSLQKLKPTEKLINEELYQFLMEKMPNVENHIIRLHYYELDKSLQAEFLLRCISKGLITLAPKKQ
jgi:transcription termination factor NusB